MDNSLPLVSIVTPSYNQGSFIEQTILSVMLQDYPNIEHIIVDGGSKDQTLDILKNYHDEYKLQWISEKDNGQSEAINKGFKLASGSIIGWLNSDDTYLPGAVSSAVSTLLANQDKSWLHGKAYWIDDQGYIIGEFPVKAFNLEDLLIYGMHIAQPSLFFRNSILDDVDGLDENIHSTMDFDFMLRVSRCFPGVFLPSYLATRRLHKAAKSVAQLNIFYEDNIKTLDKFFSNSDLPPRIMKLKRRAYHHAFLVGGYNAFRDKQLKSARELLKKSIKCDPRPWSKDNIASFILILETLIGTDRISPGVSRERSKHRFQSNDGPINVNWKKELD